MLFTNQKDRTVFINLPVMGDNQTKWQNSRNTET